MNGQNQYPNIPPPPAGGPEAKMRTLESDVQSVQKSGGGVPEPQVIKPEELGIGGAPATPVTPAPFVPAPESAPAPVPPPMVVGGKKSRGWIWWILGVVVVIAIVAIGWWVYSSYFSTSLEELLPVETGSEANLTPPLPPVTGSQSFFSFPEEDVSAVDVDGYKVVNILAGLQDAAGSLVADGQLREVALMVAGQPVELSLYLTTILPELERTNLAAVLDTEFSNDFSILLYRQNEQVWPVYVARKKVESAIDQATLLSRLAAIEETSVGNLYLVPPTGIAEFKTGPVGDKYSSRYASFDNKPASFNYGLFGDYLIMSTTYQGLVEAIDLLKL